MSAHFFGEGNGDRLNRPHYLGAFLQGVLETWDELKAEVEAVSLPVPSRGEAIAADNSDITASVALAVLAAPSEAAELPPSSAHCAAHAADADAQQAIPLKDHVPMPSRRDAVTLALAEPAEVPEPLPPPPVRPKLWIVRVAEDTYTTAREWLARERPTDYGSVKCQKTDYVS